MGNRKRNPHSLRPSPRIVQECHFTLRVFLICGPKYSDTRYKLVDSQPSSQCAVPHSICQSGPLISSTAPPGSLGHLFQPIFQNHVPYHVPFQWEELIRRYLSCGVSMGCHNLTGNSAGCPHWQTHLLRTISSQPFRSLPTLSLWLLKYHLRRAFIYFHLCLFYFIPLSSFYSTYVLPYCVLSSTFTKATYCLHAVLFPYLQA